MPVDHAAKEDASSPTPWHTFEVEDVFQRLGTAPEGLPPSEALRRLGLFTNPYLLGAVGASILLQMAVIYVPFLQNVFQTVPLSARDLGVAFVLSTAVLWVAEGEKLLGKALSARKNSPRGNE
jgi:Ca2+-transporting ATPase